MGRERMLLDRLAVRGGRGRARDQAATGEDLEVLMDSVRRQLTRLFNARHGMSQALPDYGLPALTDLTVGSGDYVVRVQQAIRTAIERYEPRLRRVQVSAIESDARESERARALGFRIDAVLVSDSGEHRVLYETGISSAGEFEVSE